MSTAFEKAKQTFLGFLQARGKAFNTIRNYAADLSSLGNFCSSHILQYQSLSLAELEAYHESLKVQGLKPNSRRRKLLTAKVFLRYHSKRADVSVVGAERVIPPDKVEKPPKLVDQKLVYKIAKNQPDSSIGWRNQALIRVLIETGMLVTEACSLKKEDVQFHKKGARIQIGGNRARKAALGVQSAAVLKELEKRLPVDSKYWFYGYRQNAPNNERLSVRGVELLFKRWVKTYRLPHLHARTLRHIFVVRLLKKGKSQSEIMSLIGLRTPYAFRVYMPLLKEANL